MNFLHHNHDLANLNDMDYFQSYLYFHLVNLDYNNLLNKDHKGYGMDFLHKILAPVILYYMDYYWNFAHTNLAQRDFALVTFDHSVYPFDYRDHHIDYEFYYFD